jgi:hypothetical protein
VYPAQETILPLCDRLTRRQLIEKAYAGLMRPPWRAGLCSWFEFQQKVGTPAMANRRQRLRAGKLTQLKVIFLAGQAQQGRSRRS